MPPEEGPSSNTGQGLLLGAVMIGLMLILEFFSWLSGDGFYSLISAIHAANAHAPAIDIDEMFFRLPTAIALCLVVLPICALLNINLDKRLPQTILMIGLVAGAMFLPVVFQERFVASYLAGHGYSRCVARDHRIGHGKSSVWFDAYVLNPADCPAG